ncbi:MAG: restriction endonuclease subunit S [Longimicrobiales bacterium]|nr:restriction endonuclease subunit S [Longimicrobiales bacterium]
MAGEWRTLSLREANITLVDCDHRTPPASDTGYPYVAIPQLRGGRIDLSDVRRITPAHFAEWTRKAKPSANDVVLSRRCNPGETAFVPPGLECALGQNLVLLRADGTRVYPPFLRWLVRGPEWWVQTGKFLNVGAVFDSLKCADVPNFKLRIPPPEEQRAIAHILGTLDDKIELNRRMNETLETMARALFKSWFVDFDPVRAKAEGRDPGLPKPLADLFPSRLVDSELGEIPEGWEVTSIGSVADVIDCLHSRKPERRESGLPLLQLSNIRDNGLIDMQDTYLIDEADYRKWVSRMEASPGDCVITNVGRVGAVAQMATAQRAALGRNMTGVRCKPAFPFPTVLIECLMSQAMKDEIGLKTDTGTILDALNVRSIPRLRFLRPRTREILDCFEHRARPLRARLERNLAASRALAALRDTLLPKLISGELRVKDAGKFIERVT